MKTSVQNVLNRNTKTSIDFENDNSFTCNKRTFDNDSDELKTNKFFSSVANSFLNKDLKVNDSLDMCNYRIIQNLDSMEIAPSPNHRFLDIT